MHMPTDRTPPISTPALRDAVATAAGRVNMYTATLDRISADIRNLEKWLDASGVRLKTVTMLHESEENWSPHGLIWDDIPEVTDHSQVVETIEWGPVTEGRWRLLYRESLHEWTVLDLVPFTGDRTVTDRQCRPLIETPAAVRIRVLPALAALICAVAEQIPERDNATQLQLLE